MTSATSRFCRKGRSSLAEKMRETPCISVVAAEVVAQSASARPTIVIRRPLCGDSIDRRRLSLRSDAASAGIAPFARWISPSTFAGLATSENTPRTTRSADGIARKSE